jgi:hypothetical protein
MGKRFLAFALFALCGAAMAAPPAPSLLPEGAEPRLFAHNGKAVALSYALGEDPAQLYVRFGSKSYGPYADVGFLAWTSDGTTLLYSALSGDSWSVYSNGKKGGLAFREGIWNWDVAPKGSDFFYRGKSGTREYMVTRDYSVMLRDSPEPLEPGTGLREYSWTPDGKAFYFSYSAYYGDTTIFKNGAALVKSQNIWNMDLSPDGKGLAYSYSEGGQGWVNKAGQKLGPFKDAYAVKWSPDGKKVAFCVDAGFSGKVQTRTVMVDSQALGTYECKYPILALWSPKGDGPYFTFGREGAYSIHGPSVDLGPFEAIVGPVFGADGMMAYAAKKAGAWKVIKGETEYGLSGAYQVPRDLVWSKSGELWWIGFDSGACSIYRDGTEVLSVEDDLLGLSLSASGQVASYLKTFGNLYNPMVLVGDQEYPGSLFGGKAAYLKEGKAVFEK